jgi:hypothetical protein
MRAPCVSALGGPGNSRAVAVDRRQRSMLMILLATCERALEAFQAADNAVDEAFVADLERIIARTRDELAEMAAQGA